jgi:hypothetical protein
LAEQNDNHYVTFPAKKAYPKRFARARPFQAPTVANATAGGHPLLHAQQTTGRKIKLTY